MHKTLENLIGKYKVDDGNCEICFDVSKELWK